MSGAAWASDGPSGAGLFQQELLLNHWPTTDGLQQDSSSCSAVRSSIMNSSFADSGYFAESSRLSEISQGVIDSSLVSDNSCLADSFLDIELELAASLAELNFSGTNVTHVSNPLRHAIVPHTDFVRTYLGAGRTKYLFLGMNPGPWGMCQTGVPFGEVRKWYR